MSVPVTDVVLRAEHLDVVYDGERPLHAVRDVSFDLRRGEILGIAGESGCGKSTLAYAISRMLHPAARLAGGRVEFHSREAGGIDLTALAGEDLRAFRWNRLSMVFQSAMNALNPVTTIGRQFDDVFRAHRPGMTARQRRDRAKTLLTMVGIDPGRVRSHAHELSGGMRQRVVIAMALALGPEVVIMDEPTTALDVVVQREILDEIVRLRDEFGFSVIFITHDLTLLLEISDRLAVMYAGRFVEHGPTATIARNAAHPYTRGLLRSFPDMLGERRELRGIPGQPPDPREELNGCAFTDRCESAFGPCALLRPLSHSLSEGEGAQAWTGACHLLGPVPPAAGAPGGDAKGTTDKERERA